MKHAIAAAASGGNAQAPRAWAALTGGHTEHGFSLRLKLTLWTAAAKSIVIWSVCGVFWLYQEAALDELLNSRRLHRASMIADDLREFPPDAFEGRLTGISSELTRVFVDDRFAIEVFDAQGHLLTTTGNGPDLPVQAAVKQVIEGAGPVVVQMVAPMDQDDPDAEESVRVSMVPMTARNGQRFVVALIVGDGFADQHSSVTHGVLLAIMIVAPATAAVTGWYVAGIAVAPLERLRKLAARLQPDSGAASFESGSAGASTEVMQLVQELDAARARVAERFAAQERFLSNVSHEIKTPISVMLTEAQTIDRKSLTPQAAKFVDSVSEEMARLGRLVESFLSLSRIQDGKGLARFRPYSANDLIMDSTDNCRKFAGHYQVRINPMLLDGEETLDLAVSGEPELLRTMLDNLILNAVRFSPEGGQVHVSAALSAADPSRVEIAVEDEGPGIPPDRIGSIFDRFSQAPNQTRHGRGHGLGLTISLGIAELHNGTITARNREPNGCVFTISLPIPSRAPILSEPPAGR